MKRLLLIMMWLVLAVPVSGATQVTNSISLSANSGGNTAQGGAGAEGQAGEDGEDGQDGEDGAVTSGRSEAELSITTTINGQVVTDVHERVTTTDGEPAVLEKVIEVHATGDGLIRTEYPAESDGDSPVLSIGSAGSPGHATASPHSTRGDDDAAATSSTGATGSTTITSVTSTTDALELDRDAVSETPTILARVTQAVTNLIAYVVSFFS